MRDTKLNSMGYVGRQCGLRFDLGLAGLISLAEAIFGGITERTSSIYSVWNNVVLGWDSHPLICPLK